MFNYVPFYKVLVLKVDVFESVIVDERHFSEDNDALAYASKMKDAGYITVIALM